MHNSIESARSENSSQYYLLALNQVAKLRSNRAHILAMALCQAGIPCG